MPFLNPRPLLPRCFAFFAITQIFATLYPMTSNPRLTYAIGLDSTVKEDHNDPRILYFISTVDSMENPPLSQVEKEQNYEPNFAGFDRSIIGRVPENNEELDNNVPMKRNIRQGETHHLVFRKGTLSEPMPATTRTPFLFESAPRKNLEEDIRGNIPVDDESQKILKRQDPAQERRTLYISLVICDQPSWKDQRLRKKPPPSLTVYISSSDKQNPGLGNSDLSFETFKGYGAKRIQASGDVFFGVTAPEDPGLDGVYNYEFTASIDALYAAYNDDTKFNNTSEDYFMRLDSDSTSALFVSNNLTIDNLSIATPPFSIFVYGVDDPTVLGIQRSLCGLRNHVQIKGNLPDGPSTSNVDTSLIRRDEGPQKQQFYTTGLNASSDYFAVLAIAGNPINNGGSVVRGGGTVGKPIRFRTKSDQNCAILYNLSFCTDVAYAVPFNPTNSNLSNLTNLAAFYDDNARNLYRNFAFARQQIPCNTTREAQYSLARNCTDCDNAYKAWLCAVTIPRCEDFSSLDLWLKPRAVNQPVHNGRPPVSRSDPALSAENRSIIHMNSSRSKMIDEQVRPGPWKEILPCKDLCYELVQSCPASMGFVCPLKGEGTESYGSIRKDANMTCNYPGKPWYFSSAAYTAANKALIFTVPSVLLLFHLRG